MAYMFHLQKVLDYRVRVEDEQNRLLGAALQEVEQAKAELARLVDHLERLQADYSSRQREQVDVQGAMLACDYVTYLSARIREQWRVVEECEHRLAEQAKLAEKAMRDRKVMDTLRDKDFSRHQHELNLAEQRLTDEVARFVYLRQKF